MPDHGSFDSPAIQAEMRPGDDTNAEQIRAAQQGRKDADRPSDEFSQWANSVSDDIENMDREKRLQHARKQIKAHQYLDGNFYGYVDSNLEWKQRDKAADEVWYTDNQIYPYLRGAAMELSRAQTQIVVSAPPGAGADLEAAAKFAQSRVDANRERTYNARLRQTRNLYSLLNGITVMYTYMDFGSGRPEKMPILQKRDKAEGEMVRLCSNCHRVVPDPVDLDNDDDSTESSAEKAMEADGDEEYNEPKTAKPKCLNCGSDAYEEVDTGGESDTIIGYDDQKTGHNQWVCPNPIGLIFYMQASCIAETPYVKWKQPILRAVIEAQFPDMRIQGGGLVSLELRYVTDQTKAVPSGDQGASLTGATSTEGGSDAFEVLEYQRHWLDYPMYCNKTFKDDVSFGNGKVLKAGQKLGTMFKKGLYFSRVGTLILEVWDEDKNRKFTSSPYGLRPGSMYGTGSSVALSDQETLNDLETLKMANAWSNGVPREFVDPAYIKELSADPTIPTTLTASVVDGNIKGRAYDMAPAATLSPEIYALSERRESSIQNKIGAMSATGSGGLADTQKWGDTATAISIKRDLAVGRFAPDLELGADQLDREQAIQFCENEKEFFTENQWKKITGDYGQYGLQCFLQVDLQNDLLWTVAAGSWMPKSDAQTQAKFIQYAELLPVLAQVQNPEILAYAAEVFGIPEYIGGWATERAHVSRLIARFKSLTQLFIETFGDIPDPNIDEQGSPAVVVGKKINDYSQVPVDTFLDDHAAIINALRDWRETDEGQSAPNVLLAAVAFRILLHQTAKTKQAQMDTRSMIEASAPLEEKQNEAMAQQQDAAAQEQANAAQEQGLNKIADLADKEADRTSKEKMQSEKLAHEKDMAPPALLPSADQSPGIESAQNTQ